MISSYPGPTECLLLTGGDIRARFDQLYPGPRGMLAPTGGGDNAGLRLSHSGIRRASLRNLSGYDDCSLCQVSCVLTVFPSHGLCHVSIFLVLWLSVCLPVRLSLSLSHTHILSLTYPSMPTKSRCPCRPPPPPSRDATDITNTLTHT